MDIKHLYIQGGIKNADIVEVNIMVYNLKYDKRVKQTDWHLEKIHFLSPVCEANSSAHKTTNNILISEWLDVLKPLKMFPWILNTSLD